MGYEACLAPMGWYCFRTKNLTVGEGGMLTTNDAELACKARIIIGHGIDNTTYKRELSSKPWHREASLVGYNFRLSNLLAAIGVEQLKKIGENECQKADSCGYL